MMTATQNIKFMGRFDPTKHYKVGDVVVDGKDTKVFTGTSWEKIDGGGKPLDPPKTIIPKVCSQCGAPTNPHRTTCEYCGCRY